MPDPFGPGLPADTARAVPDLYKWQPIGNYLAKPFPMWPSVLEGLEELNYQANSHPGDINVWAIASATVVGQWLKHSVMDPTVSCTTGSTTSNVWCCGATRCGSKASAPTTVTCR